jgi:hypothetical protein
VSGIGFDTEEINFQGQAASQFCRLWHFDHDASFYCRVELDGLGLLAPVFPNIPVRLHLCDSLGRGRRIPQVDPHRQCSCQQALFFCSGKGFR